MRISTETGSIARLVGVEESVRIIAKEGFDAFDFTMFDFKAPHLLLDDCLNLAKRLKQISAEYGIVCNQTHAPFPPSMETLPLFKQAIQCTAAAGSNLCIIHPLAYNPTEESVAFYQALLPTAKEYGVKIATENMMGWNNSMKERFYATGATPEHFVEVIDAVNDPYLVACLDIGHTEIRPIAAGSAPMIAALGNRLHALHMHDNDLKDDNHQLPGTMNIDFNVVIKSLHDIGYSGDFTLEAIHYLDNCTTENLAEGVHQMAVVARELANRFERL